MGMCDVCVFPRGPMSRRISLAAALVCSGLLPASLVFTPSAFAQQTLGALNGTVTDSTGAVVSGATVQITGVGTGIQRSVTSSGSGAYQFLNL